MYQTSTILSLKSNSQTAIDQFIQRLGQAGFQVLPSFDLKVARAAHVGCACPYHGTDQCDCQMVVLLVYGQDETPVTLVIHGHDGQTEIALVDTPEQGYIQHTIHTILDALGWPEFE